MIEVIALLIEHWIITGWIIAIIIFLICNNKEFIDWTLKGKHNTFFNLFSGLGIGLIFLCGFSTLIYVIKLLWNAI